MTETKKENEREIVLAILIEVLEKNQFSHIVIRQALDKYSYLSQKERSFIARLSRGCVERKIELDAIIDKAILKYLCTANITCIYQFKTIVCIRCFRYRNTFFLQRRNYFFYAISSCVTMHIHWMALFRFRI